MLIVGHNEMGAYCHRAIDKLIIVRVIYDKIPLKIRIYWYNIGIPKEYLYKFIGGSPSIKTTSYLHILHQDGISDKQFIITPAQPLEYPMKLVVPKQRHYKYIGIEYNFIITGLRHSKTLLDQHP